MTASHPTTDRRQFLRLEAAGMNVSLRPRGRLGAMPAEAVDFNRYGIAVRTAQPITRDQPVYLNLDYGEIRVDQLVGIVHNCVRQGDRYRIGIRFRLSSQLQRDRPLTERCLSCLEAAVLAAARQSA